MLHEENYIAYLCPNMIYFDALDFSERRSEEVMFFDAHCISMHAYYHLERYETLYKRTCITFPRNITIKRCYYCNELSNSFKLNSSY